MSAPRPYSLPILTGVTGSGKTRMTLNIAQNSPSPVEFINCDSLLFYREVAIGTAKPTPEEQEIAPHQAIDFLALNEEANVKDYLIRVENILARAHAPASVIVGGSGFYLKGLVTQLWEAPPTDAAFRASVENIETAELFARLQKKYPARAAQVHENDRYRVIRSLEILNTPGGSFAAPQDAERPLIQPSTIGITDFADESLLIRILTHRIESMFDEGFIEECEHVLAKAPGAKVLRAVGYAEVAAYLLKKKTTRNSFVSSLDELKKEILLSTRQLVKRQRTWFKSQIMPLFKTERLTTEKQKKEWSKRLWPD